MLGAATLLLGVALTGCGGDGGGEADAEGSANASDAAPGNATDNASDAAPEGLLYQDRDVTLSKVWAVKNGCPLHVYVEFTDDGPRVLKTDPRVDEEAAEETPGRGRYPVLQWTSPCDRSSSQFDFDDAPVTKVTGEQSQSGCQEAARRSVGDGTSHKGYQARALKVGDQFCEELPWNGRVLLMRVAELGGDPVSEISLKATLWAGQRAEQNPAGPGEAVYKDGYVSVSDEVAESRDCGVGYVNLFTDTPRVVYDKGRGPGASADMNYFPACLSGEGKIRVSGYVAAVDGDGEMDVSTCQDAAAGGESGSIEREVSELRVGDRFCQYDMRDDAVALIGVTAVTPGPSASVDFSVTHWNAPGGD